MKRLLLSLILCFSVISCASLNPLDILNPDKPSLEVNAQVGKTNEQEKNNIKVESGKQEIKQEADKISNDHNYKADTIENITQQFSKEVLYLVLALIGIVIFLGGWAIPPPKECLVAIETLLKKTYLGIKFVISDILFTFILTPIKAIADFILKLFGKV